MSVQNKSIKQFVLNISRYPEQVSHTIALEKGKKYYLEAIGKQEDSDDNLSVGVELPDGKKMFPIPGSLLRKSKVSSGKANLFVEVNACGGRQHCKLCVQILTYTNKLNKLVFAIRNLFVGVCFKDQITKNYSMYSISICMRNNAKSRI